VGHGAGFMIMMMILDQICLSCEYYGYGYIKIGIYIYIYISSLTGMAYEYMHDITSKRDRRDRIILPVLYHIASMLVQIFRFSYFKVISFTYIT